MGAGMTYIPMPQETKWGETTIRSVDKEVIDLLNEILKELMKININLSLMTDTEITEGDL